MASGSCWSWSSRAWCARWWLEWSWDWIRNRCFRLLLTSWCHIDSNDTRTSELNSWEGYTSVGLVSLLFVVVNDICNQSCWPPSSRWGLSVAQGWFRDLDVTRIKENVVLLVFCCCSVSKTQLVCKYSERRCQDSLLFKKYQNSKRNRRGLPPHSYLNSITYGGAKHFGELLRNVNNLAQPSWHT